jgi:Ni/Fe-hydrogenase subunit HybB-like protein
MTAVWAVLAAIGAVAFLLGAGSPDAGRTWSIYLVNVVFWSGLAVSGPAIAAMMQLTEARWSPSVRRIAVTTVGFLPVAFVLLLVLFLGRDVLYPWVRTPIPVKAAWLNTPFFFLRTLGLAAVLFSICFIFAAAILRDSVPPGDETVRARRNRLATALLFFWLITV